MRKPLIVVLGLLPALAAAYSLFSLGRPREPFPLVDARGAALGNTALGLWDGRNLSLLNPASIAGLENSTFTLSARRENNSYSVAEGSSVYSAVDLPNVQFVFDLPNGFTLGCGWQERQSWRFEYSRPVYDPEGEDPDTPIGTARVSGRGAVNGANLAVGFAPDKDLGLGLRLTGLIGTPREVWRIEYGDDDDDTDDEADDYADTNDVLETEVIGLALAAGINLHLGQLDLGAYLEYPLFSDVTSTTGSTFGEVQREETTFDYPINMGVGAGWRPNPNLSLAADFRYEMWSGFSIGGETLGYTDTMHAGLGLEVIPSRRLNDFFLWRMPWRVGGYYETLYDSPQGDPLTEWGVTAGTGMFFGEESESSIDFAFQYARRGDLAANGLEEEFLRFIITLNGAENWW